jgi:hypothetical protein
MSAIGPGDWVECIDASPHARLPDRQILQLGKLYCIRDVTTGLRLNGKREAALRLVGLVLPVINRPGNEYAWSPARFRPIYRPRDNAEFIEKLKTPAPPETVEV